MEVTCLHREDLLLILPSISTTVIILAPVIYFSVSYSNKIDDLYPLRLKNSQCEGLKSGVTYEDGKLQIFY
jgi:hypothetical protein